MKTILKPKRIPNDFKRIDSTNIIVTNKDIPRRRVQVKPNHLSFNQLSEKLSILAEPKPKKVEENIYSHWEIKESTLKYKATKRIKKLAKPKTVVPKVCNLIGMNYIGSHSSVSPKALKYKPTQRILELAKPKYGDFYTVVDEDVYENVSDLFLLRATD